MTGTTRKGSSAQSAHPFNLGGGFDVTGWHLAEIYTEASKIVGVVELKPYDECLFGVFPVPDLGGCPFRKSPKTRKCRGDRGLQAATKEWATFSQSRRHARRSRSLPQVPVPEAEMRASTLRVSARGCERRAYNTGVDRFLRTSRKSAGHSTDL